MKYKVMPRSIEEAVDYLLKKIAEHNPIGLEDFVGDERGFLGATHMYMGMNIRNEWFLWWFPEHGYDTWPKEAPELIKDFEKIGIYHGDDRSGIILTCVYRKYFNLPLDIEHQVKRYDDHWIKSLGHKLTYEDNKPRTNKNKRKGTS